MKNPIQLVLLAALAAGITVASASDVIGINALTENPAGYSDRSIVIEGHVDRVSAARRMVVLIDTAEATCTDGCDRRSLLVQVPEATDLPEKGANIQANGKLNTSGEKPVFEAVSLAGK